MSLTSCHVYFDGTDIAFCGFINWGEENVEFKRQSAGLGKEHTPEQTVRPHSHWEEDRDLAEQIRSWHGQQRSVSSVEHEAQAQVHAADLHFDLRLASALCQIVAWYSETVTFDRVAVSWLKKWSWDRMETCTIKLPLCKCWQPNCSSLCYDRLWVISQK